MNARGATVSYLESDDFFGVDGLSVLPEFEPEGLVARQCDALARLHDIAYLLERFGHMCVDRHRGLVLEHECIGVIERIGDLNDRTPQHRGDVLVERCLDGHTIGVVLAGERLEDKKDLPALYKEFGESFQKLDSWSAFMITSYEDTERYFGRKADKNRKIYNNMI